MNTTEKRQIIIAALIALGVNFKKLEIASNKDTVSGVYVDGKFLGMFDYIKRTFVN